MQARPQARTGANRLAVLPHDFIWGASTSSYQIEGGAREGGRGMSIWDTHCRETGRISGGHTGDAACDHYHRYAEDVELMRRLGMRAYRFSVAWPRVLPRGMGKINETGLDFYDRLIDELLDSGIEPWLCLYHWDLPQALDDLGGWTNRDSAGWFADYAALLARRYGDRVRRFATFNEPSVFVLFGYGFGWNAPGVADRSAYFRAMHHVNLAHGRAVDVLRSLAPSASIGAIHNRQKCLPSSSSPEDAHAAALLDQHWNRAFPDAQILGHYPPDLAEAVESWTRPGDIAQICRPIDWFGLNHYAPIYGKATVAPLGFAWGDAPGGIERTDIGWPIHAAAFRDELAGTAVRYRLPIYVLENGYGGREQPDAEGRIDDRRRIDYLDAYIGAMAEAVALGADIRGYFVWSLLDNFEWGSGYNHRFGIVYVDFDSQRRIPKASAEWYAALIRASAGGPPRGEEP
ncbi:MAG: beta-glucosidase [Alphaproteobacteria bacterium]|nr:beta-glucosidase [Alphaproteobacteria bacterium]